jgi:hypothetical protein
LAGYSHVVFWGDFVNSPIYADPFAKVDVELGHSETRAAARDRWLQIYTRPKSLTGGRVLSVGTNFQVDPAPDDPLGKVVYRNVGANFDLILPRDKYSTHNIRSRLPAQSPVRVVQGLDCAFLLAPPTRPEARPYFAYYFGRSKFAEPWRLVGEVSQRTGIQGRPIDGWLSVNAHNAHHVFERCRATLAGAAFVISDTYHVCVNAMAAGVPVFGIGRDHTVQHGTLGDFKKRTLFAMFNLQDSYFADPGQPEREFFQGVADSIAQMAPSASSWWVDRSEHIREKVCRFREDIAASVLSRERGDAGA